MNDDAVIKQAEKEFGLMVGEIEKPHAIETPKNGNSSKILTIDDILSMPDVHEEWLVEPFVLSHGITIISGLPNHYKSFFVQMLVKSVASGETFLDRFATDKGAVMVVDREIPKQRLKKRWGSIGNLYGLPIYFYDYSSPFKLDNPVDAQALQRLVKEKSIRLVVIDTFNRVHRSKDLSSPSDVATIFEPLKAVLDQAAVILIHHSNKSGYGKDVPTPEELLGSIDFVAETDLLFTLRKKGKDLVEVHNLKSRDSELIDPFQLTFQVDESGKTAFAYGGLVVNAESPVEAREQKILEYLKHGKISKESLIVHMKEVGDNEGTVNNTLTVLRRKGLIASETTNSKAFYFLIDHTQEAFHGTSGTGSVKSGNSQEKIDLSGKIGSQADNEIQALDVSKAICYTCGGSEYRKRPDGQLLCAVCHPPVNSIEGGL